jgi:putative Mn2+ efflux pump MntP
MEHTHELPEWLHIFEEIDILRGMIFGLVHTIIPVIGYYTGWSINRLLKIISNGYVAGLVGVILAHVIADFIAATLDPHLKSAAFGIVLGGLIPLSLIPIMEKYVTKSKYHIVVGDHDDIQKDLKKKHS